MLAQARELGLKCLESAVYGATQGPRLETAAEINRMERDGCDSASFGNGEWLSTLKKGGDK